VGSKEDRGRVPLAEKLAGDCSVAAARNSSGEYDDFMPPRLVVVLRQIPEALRPHVVERAEVLLKC